MREVRQGEAGLKWANVARQVQESILAIEREEVAAVKQATEQELKALDDRIKQAQEVAAEAGGKYPAAIKLQMLTEALTVSTPEVDTEKQAKIEEKIREALKEVRTEELSELKTSLSEADAAWEESAPRTAAAQAARYDAIRKAYAAIQSVVDEYTKKYISANAKADEEAKKIAESLAGIQVKSTGQQQIAALDEKKLAVEQEYAGKVVKTYQDQISYADQLAAIETQRLQIKLVDAEIAHENALDEENLVKIAQTGLEVDQARAALRLQQQSAAAAHAKGVREASFTGQVEPAIVSSIDSGFNAASKAIADLVTQTKGWGQEFSKIPKEVANSIVKDIVGGALKQVENAGKAVFKGLLNDITGGAGGGIGAQLGQIFHRTAAPAAVSAGAGAVNPGLAANTVAVHGLTFSIQALNAALLGNTGATTADAAATAASAGSTVALTVDNSLLSGIVLANTLAVAANTAAVTAQTTTEVVTSFLHFAAGGRVTPGAPSVIGEKGPELFIPDVPGTIISNSDWNKMAGAGSSSTALTTNFNTGQIGQQHFHLYGLNDPRQMMRQIAIAAKTGIPGFSPLNSN